MQKNFVSRAVALFAVLISAAVCIPMLAAQDNMGGQSAMGAGGNMTEAAAKLEKMSTALQLTPTQKEQIRPILMEEAPKVKAIKSDTSLGPMQKAMKMHQIADATDAKLKPILNPEQYEKWQQMRAEERQQMMQKMQNH